jgi:hypothetical protein
MRMIVVDRQVQAGDVSTHHEGHGGMSMTAPAHVTSVREDPSTEGCDDRQA